MGNSWKETEVLEHLRGCRGLQSAHPTPLQHPPSCPDVPMTGAAIQVTKIKPRADMLTALQSPGSGEGTLLGPRCPDTSYWVVGHPTAVTRDGAPLGLGMGRWGLGPASPRGTWLGSHCRREAGSKWGRETREVEPEVRGPRIRLPLCCSEPWPVLDSGVLREPHPTPHRAALS